MSRYEIHWEPMVAWMLFLVMFVGLPLLALALDTEEPAGPDNRWDAELAVEATQETRWAVREALEHAEQDRESQRNDP